MKKALRIKATSSCMGIRRSIVEYIDYSDGKYEFKASEYPMNKIMFEINYDQILFNEETFKLNDGETKEFILRKNVSTLSGDKEIETLVITFLTIPLDINLSSHYGKLIENDYILDEEQGELEYILYLINRCSNLPQAQDWLLKSSNKGFRLAKRKKEVIN